ncbi:unnamed protein product, partial [Amoebophrya sp. A25]
RYLANCVPAAISQLLHFPLWFFALFFWMLALSYELDYIEYPMRKFSPEVFESYAHEVGQKVRAGRWQNFYGSTSFRSGSGSSTTVASAGRAASTFVQEFVDNLDDDDAMAAPLVSLGGGYGGEPGEIDFS